MDRKGFGWRTIGQIVLTLTVVLLLFYFLRQGFGALDDTWTCPHATDPQYVLKPAADGCKSVGVRVAYKFKDTTLPGGGKGVCCLKKSTGGGTGSGPPEPEFSVRVYDVDIDRDPRDAHLPLTSGDTINDLVGLSHGTRIITSTDLPQPIMIEIEARNCNADCRSRVRFHFDAETEAGVDVLNIVERVPVTGKKTLGTPETLKPTHLPITTWDRISGDTAQADRTLIFTFPPRFTGERVTFTAKSIYEPKPVSGTVVEPVEKEHVIYFDVRSPLIYRGLTTPWTKTKTISATCLDPVKCSNVYYKIVPASSTDPLLPADPVCPTLTSMDILNARQIMEAHCIIDERGRHVACYDTNKACVEEGLAKLVSSEHTAAYQALVQGVEANLIPDNVLIAFGRASHTQSKMSCQPSLPTFDVLTGTMTEPIFHYTFKANHIINTEQFQFTLNMPSMTGQYLCVYGENRHTFQIYSAGPPQRIHVDRIPPDGTANFNHATLQLTFTCDDEHSGCSPYHGIAYISDVSKFFRALVSTEKSQKASSFCPPFASGGAYRTETRDTVVYPHDMLQILCLRSVDKAGNAAVSMIPVYNRWHLLALALQQYLEEKQEGDVTVGP